MALRSGIHTTDYQNTFISVAEDCPVTEAEVPVAKGGKPTVASMQFDMIEQHPYKYTSDDVIFLVHAGRNGISKKDQPAERELFFSKGQPCLRASPLGKRYGWGVHSDEKGKVAIYAVESDEYKKLSEDKQLTQVKAMRSKRG